MAKNRKYKFTNKQIPPQSVMSASLGIIGAAGSLIVTVLSFKNNGNAEIKFGLTIVLSMLFALTGLVLGIWSRMIKDVYYSLAYFGIGINSVVLLFGIYILGLGIMAM